MHPGADPLDPPQRPPAAGDPALQVLVTRPRGQCEAWVQALRDGGVAAQALPLLEIAPLGDPAPLHAAWRRLPGVAFVMFVSANAVAAFFAARPPGAAWPEAAAAGATGPGTVAALREAGLSPAQIEAPPADAPTFDAEALWARIGEPASRWAGRQVLVVRGEEGRDWLAERWREQGATVDFVAAYRRDAPRWSDAEAALCDAAVARPAQHLWLFSSSEAVARLAQLRPQADWRAARALATHPRIAEAAARLGFCHPLTVAPTPQAVLEGVRSLESKAS